MARLAQHAEVVSRIFLHHQSELDAAFHILFDRLNHRNLSIQYHVHDFRPFLRPNADPVARFHLGRRRYLRFPNGWSD